MVNSVQNPIEANSINPSGGEEIEVIKESKGHKIYTFVKEKLKEKEVNPVLPQLNVAVISLNENPDNQLVTILKVDIQVKAILDIEKQLIDLKMDHVEITQVAAQLLVLLGDDPEFEVNFTMGENNVGYVIETWLV